MGRKKDTRILLDAAQSWLNELECEIVPNVLTKEERKSYGKQARVLRAALGRHSGSAVAAELEQSTEQPAVDAQTQRNLAQAIARTAFGPSPAEKLGL